MFKSKSFHAPNVGCNTARIPSTPGTGRVLKTNALVMKSPYPKCSDEFNRLSKITNQPPTTTLEKAPEKDQPTILHSSDPVSMSPQKDLVGSGELELSPKQQIEQKKEIDQLLRKSAIEARTVKVPASKKRSFTDSPSTSKGSKPKKFNFTFKKK